MAKTSAKTSASAAAAGKNAEAAAAAAAALAEAAAAAAAALEPVPAPTYPYLLSLETLREIFGNDATIATTTTTTTTAHKLRLLQQALGVVHCDANPRSATWVEWCFDVLCFARSRDERDSAAGAGGFALAPKDPGDDCSDKDDATIADEKTLLLLTIADDIFQFAVSPLPQTSSDDTSEMGNSHSASCQPSLTQCYDRFRARILGVSCVLPPPPITAPTNTDTATTDDSSTALDECTNPPLAPVPRPPTLSPGEVASFVAFMSATLFRHLAAYQYVHRHTRASVTRVIHVCVEAPFPPLPLAAATKHDEQLVQSSSNDTLHLSNSTNNVNNSSSGGPIDSA